MMTPLQEWFFMNVEGNVPSAEECRERFDAEFTDRMECLSGKIRQFLINVLTGEETKVVDMSEDLFGTLIDEVKSGLGAAQRECDLVGKELDFPGVLRQGQILLSVLENMNGRR